MEQINRGDSDSFTWLVALKLKSDGFFFDFNSTQVKVHHQII